MLRDNESGYGVVSRVLHWAIALAIFGLFALGWWMVELDYASPYYNAAPAWHEAIGILVLVAMALRVGWRIGNPKPHSDFLSPFERVVSRLVHWAFYVLIFAVLISGYLISTADGRAIDLFFGLQMPSLIEIQGIESLSGKLHRLLSYAIMVLAGLHTGAALKHHFVDRDQTMTRMWRGGERSKTD